MKDILKEYESEAKKIKKALSKYSGLTIPEARDLGWGEREDRLQARLWWIGYEIVRLRDANKLHG